MNRFLVFPGRRNSLFSSMNIRTMALLCVMILGGWGVSEGQTLTRYFYDLDGDDPDIERLDIYHLSNIPPLPETVPQQAGYIFYIIYGDGQAEKREVSLSENPTQTHIPDQWFIHKYLEPYIPANPLQHDAFVEMVPVYTQDDNPPPDPIRAASSGSGVNFASIPNFSSIFQDVIENPTSIFKTKYLDSYIPLNPKPILFGYEDLGNELFRVSTSWNIAIDKPFILRINYSNLYDGNNCEGFHFETGPYIKPIDITMPPNFGIIGESIIYNSPPPSIPLSPPYEVIWTPLPSVPGINTSYSTYFRVNTVMPLQEQRSVFVFFRAAPDENVLGSQIYFKINDPDQHPCDSTGSEETVYSSFDPNQIVGPCCLQIGGEELSDDSFPYSMEFYNKGYTSPDSIVVIDTLDKNLMFKSLASVSIGKSTFPIPPNFPLPGRIELLPTASNPKMAIMNVKEIPLGDQNVIIWEFKDINLEGTKGLESPNNDQKGKIKFTVKLKPGKSWDNIMQNPPHAILNTGSVIFFDPNSFVGHMQPLSPYMTCVSDSCERTSGNQSNVNEVSFGETCTCTCGNHKKFPECEPQPEPCNLSWLCWIILLIILILLFFLKHIKNMFKGKNE